MGKARFTLKSVQHRIAKRDILLDVLIDGKLVKKHPVAWVKLRGSEDPLYLKKMTPLLMDYKEQIEAAQKELTATKEDQNEVIKELTATINKLLAELLNASVVEALCDWDADFFGCEFSYEAAHEIFNDAANNEIYNQVAEYMKDRESFLPIASA